MAKIWKQPKCPPMDEENMTDTQSAHTQNTTQHKKNDEVLVLYNMDGTWWHYAKWNKSKRKTNTVWFHLWNIKNKKQIR